MEADVGHEHEGHNMHGDAHKAGHRSEHGAHIDHTGHEQMFRDRFWVSLVLTVPVPVCGWVGLGRGAWPSSSVR